MRFPAPLLAGVALLASCELDARERLVMATDRASRYGFRYIQDRETGQWVHLHCEVRVPATRRLPEPITSHETGDLLHFTEFGDGTMGSAGVDKNEQELRDGYRVWLYRATPGQEHYKGTAGFGIQVTWPNPGTETRYEPLETFRLPAVRGMTPYVWTPWRKADEVSGGAFADWEKVHGRDPSEPKPAASEPFEMRCRAVLSEALYIPVRAEDANATKPDPRAGKL